MAMALPLALLLLLPLSLAQRPVDCSLTWTPCRPPLSSNVPPSIASRFECATFNVPLDYADPAAGQAALVVVRYPASNTSAYRGSLLVNPGGPGVGGVSYLFGSAQGLSRLTDGEFDLVSWDPRGVGNSEPRITCFSSASEEERFWGIRSLRPDLQARGSLEMDQSVEDFLAQAETIDAQLVQVDEICEDAHGANRTYVGSAASARDIASLASALDGADSPINFLGYSYGTLLGQILVNLFPDRVGRVVIDGVIDPENWALAQAHERWGPSISEAETVLEYFAEYALSTTSSPFSTFSSPVTLISALRTLFSDLTDLSFRPNIQLGATPAEVRITLFNALYDPGGWADVAAVLGELYADVERVKRVLDQQKRGGERAAVRPGLAFKAWMEERGGEAQVRRQGRPSNDGVYGQSQESITCADAPSPAPKLSTRDVLASLVNVTHTISPTFGTLWTADLMCHRWAARAVERYTGPWGAETAEQVLVLSSSYDPITPRRSAEHVADLLGPSGRLYIQETVGHTTVAGAESETLHLLRTHLLAAPELDRADTTCAAGEEGGGGSNGAARMFGSTKMGVWVVLGVVVAATAL